MDYIGWLDQGLPAEFKVINNDNYEIDADVGEGEGVLVQMTHDPGFRAVSSAGRVKIKKDPLGFMVLEPSTSGKQEISLTHGKTLVHWLGYLITGLTLLVLIVYPVFRKFYQKNETAPKD